MRLIDADALIEGRVSNDNVVICAKCAPTIDAIPVEWLKRKLEEVEGQAEPHFAYLYVLHEWQDTKSIEELQAESEMRDYEAEQKELER